MDVERLYRGICFEWDSTKAAANHAKHGVSFEEACQVFFDPFVHWLADEVIGGEVRETVVGLSERWHVLWVVYTVRVDDRLRLISARMATAEERRAYEQQ